MGDKYNKRVKQYRTAAAELHTCSSTGKRQYRSEAAALAAIGTLNNARDTGFLTDRGKMPIRVYECVGSHGCYMWHLTSETYNR